MSSEENFHVDLYLHGCTSWWQAGESNYITEVNRHLMETFRLHCLAFFELLRYRSAMRANTKKVQQRRQALFSHTDWKIRNEVQLNEKTYQEKGRFTTLATSYKTAWSLQLTGILSVSSFCLLILYSTSLASLTCSSLCNKHLPDYPDLSFFH